MTIEELGEKAPTWLRNARTENARVAIVGGVVIWHDGEWRGGEWLDGIWHGGIWLGGAWRGGIWRRGEWHGGAWHGGEWHGGIWRRGTWLDGEWHGGIWLGGAWLDGIWRRGEWHGGENRLLYMASLLGIVFRDGIAVAYRTTKRGGIGRHDSSYLQTEGAFEIPDAAPAGAGTCRPGIHVTSAARAWTYFGVDPECEFWRVEFKAEDLLDCDGDKARVRAGVATRIKRPF